MTRGCVWTQNGLGSKGPNPVSLMGKGKPRTIFKPNVAVSTTSLKRTSSSFRSCPNSGQILYYPWLPSGRLSLKTTSKSRCLRRRSQLLTRPSQKFWSNLSRFRDLPRNIPRNAFFHLPFATVSELSPSTLAIAFVRLLLRSPKRF